MYTLTLYTIFKGLRGKSRLSPNILSSVSVGSWVSVGVESQSGLSPFGVESHSGLSPVGVQSIRCSVPFGDQSHSGLGPFGVQSHLGFSPFGVESHSGLGPFGVQSIRGSVHSRLSLSRFGLSRFSRSRFSRWIPASTVDSVLRLITVQNLLFWLACYVLNGPPSFKYQYSLGISSFGLSSLWYKHSWFSSVQCSEKKCGCFYLWVNVLFWCSTAINIGELHVWLTAVKFYNIYRTLPVLRSDCQKSLADFAGCLSQCYTYDRPMV